MKYFSLLKVEHTHTQKNQLIEDLDLKFLLIKVLMNIDIEDRWRLWQDASLGT